MRLDDFLNLLFQKAREAGLSEYEAYVASGDSFEASVHAGELIAYNVSSTMGLGFRALTGDRMGYASTQALDEAAAEMLVKGAVASATLTETEDPQFLFTGAKIPALDVYNPALTAIPDAEKVEMALALEMSRRMLSGRGAWRIHGGGFAGTILAFVPFSLMDEYAARMNAVFGAGAVTRLGVRPVGPAIIGK